MFEHQVTERARWVAALAITTIASGALIAAPVAAQDEAPSCGTEPVELLAYFETGFPFVKALADEFTKQFPNVTWNIREDQFTNLMTQDAAPARPSDNPPDLIRLPSMVDPGPGRPAPEPRPVLRGVRLGHVAGLRAGAASRRRERPAPR